LMCLIVLIHLLIWNPSDTDLGSHSFANILFMTLVSIR
jgi:hypothetical protein